MKKGKIIRSLFLILLLCIIPFVVYWINAGINTLRLENKLDMQKTANSILAYKVNAYIFEKIMGTTNTLVKTKAVINQVLDSDHPDRKDTLITLNTTKALFDASIVYIMDTRGNTIACTPYGNGKSLTGKNYAFRPYFIRAIQGENVIYAALGVTTKKRGIYFSTPIFNLNGSTPIGVVVVKIGLDQIDSLIRKSEQKIALVSPQGIVFSSTEADWMFHAAFPLREEEMKQLRDSQQFAEEPLAPLPVILDEGKIELDNKMYYVVKNPISTLNWTLVSLEQADTNFILKPTHKILIYSFLVLIVFLNLVIVVLVLNTIKRRRAEKELMASQQKSQDSADYLREIIDNVNVQAEALAESSQSLQENGGIIEGNVSATSNSISEITSLVDNLSSLTDMVNQNSSKVMTTSEQGLNTTESGMASVEEMKSKMTQIERSSETSTKEIVELNEHSKKINNVMNIINNIADQTKLIAFNASLEASSAGEAGKRFSVVAVEIRRLADNVMESTNEIRATIKNINESVERLLIYSGKESSYIQEGISSLDEIVNILKQILNDAEIQSKLSKDIIQHTNEQININNQVLAKTTEISNGTHETSESVQQSGFIATILESVSKELRHQLEKT